MTRNGEGHRERLEEPCHKRWTALGLRAARYMYMFSDKEREYQGNFNELVSSFIEAVPSSTPILLDIGRKVIEGNLYGAMKACKKLMRYEEEVLKHVTQ